MITNANNPFFSCIQVGEAAEEEVAEEEEEEEVKVGSNSLVFVFEILQYNSIITHAFLNDN